MIEIPVSVFDQSKLEQLLRKAPVAFVREEYKDDFLRKYYQLPQEVAPFRVSCHADYYNSAKIPSFEFCSIKTSAKTNTDEIYLEVPNFGLGVQKFYSTERVYGQSFDGKYRQLFRYMFDCSSSLCKITFAVKEATP